MVVLELCCLLLLGTSLLLRLRAGGRGWLSDAPIVFLAAWLGEDSVIRVHHFYAYAPSWHAFADVTPLLIPTIWVMVVLSARDVARALAPGREVLICFALVAYDASLIEPICTHAGMWRWLEPGPWSVPIIGTLGWACFGGSAVFWLERLRGRWRWLTAILAPLSMHALLLILWWGALRWLPRGDGLAPPMLAIAALVVAAFAAAALLSTRRARSVPLEVIAARLGPAAFFFALLWVSDAPGALWTYTASFALPWMVVTRWARAPESRPASAIATRAP